jgi:hypothetical protein
VPIGARVSSASRSGSAHGAKPEVEQHRDSAVAPDHVRRLQVLMHDVLPMQAVAGPRQGDAEPTAWSSASRGVSSSTSW